DQRNRRQRFLAAREEMDAGIALARRLCHDLHPGVEDLLPGHDELRFAAAEERREKRAEVAVDGFERLAQELALLAGGPAHRVLQRLHRLLEVRGLRIGEGLAAAARAQLLPRREAYCARLAHLP